VGRASEDHLPRKVPRAPSVGWAVGVGTGRDEVLHPGDLASLDRIELAELVDPLAAKRLVRVLVADADTGIGKPCGACQCFECGALAGPLLAFEDKHAVRLTAWTHDACNRRD